MSPAPELVYTVDINDILWIETLFAVSEFLNLSRLYRPYEARPWAGAKMSTSANAAERLYGWERGFNPLSRIRLDRQVVFKSGSNAGLNPYG